MSGFYGRCWQGRLRRKAHGKFDELKASVDYVRATEFFIVVEHQNFRESRLAMLVDAYLRYFLLNGGQDPYPENEFDRKYKTKNAADMQHSGEDRKPVGVVLTDDVMAGKSVTTSVKKRGILKARLLPAW